MQTVSIAAHSCPRGQRALRGSKVDRIQQPLPCCIEHVTAMPFLSLLAIFIYTLDLLPFLSQLGRMCMPTLVAVHGRFVPPRARRCHRL